MWFEEMRGIFQSQHCACFKFSCDTYDCNNSTASCPKKNIYTLWKFVNFWMKLRKYAKISLSPILVSFGKWCIRRGLTTTHYLKLHNSLLHLTFLPNNESKTISAFETSQDVTFHACRPAKCLNNSAGLATSLGGHEEAIIRAGNLLQTDYSGEGEGRELEERWGRTKPGKW